MSSTCKFCFAEFKQKRVTQIYCCRECYIKGSNKERSEIKKVWNTINKDRIRQSQQKWLENNPDKRKEASSSYMKRNRPYYANYSSIRNRHMMCATPSWVDKQELLDVCAEAQYQGLEVDHILPLKGKLVCGLHVPENLQLLTREENARKNNKFQPFDEDVQCVVHGE